MCQSWLGTNGRGATYYLKLGSVLLEPCLISAMAMLIVAILSISASPIRIWWQFSAMIGWHGITNSSIDYRYCRLLVGWMILAGFGCYFGDVPTTGTIGVIYVCSSMFAWLPPYVNAKGEGRDSDLGQYFRASGPVGIVFFTLVQLAAGTVIVPLASAVIHQDPRVYVPWIDSITEYWPVSVLFGAIAYVLLLLDRVMHAVKGFRLSISAIATVLLHYIGLGQYYYFFLGDPLVDKTVGQVAQVIAALSIVLLTICVSGTYEDKYGVTFDTMSDDPSTPVNRLECYTMRGAAATSRRIRPLPRILAEAGDIPFVLLEPDEGAMQDASEDSSVSATRVYKESVHGRSIHCLEGVLVFFIIMMSMVIALVVAAYQKHVRAFLALCGFIGWISIGSCLVDGEFSSFSLLPSMLIAVNSPIQGQMMPATMLLILFGTPLLIFLPLVVSTSFVDLERHGPIHMVCDLVQPMKIYGPLYSVGFIAITELLLAFVPTPACLLLSPEPQPSPASLTIWEALIVAVSIGAISLITIQDGAREYIYAVGMGGFGVTLSLGLYWIGPEKCMNTALGQYVAVLVTIAIELTIVIGVSTRQRRLYPERYVYVDSWRLGDFFKVFTNSLCELVDDELELSLLNKV